MKTPVERPTAVARRLQEQLDLQSERLAAMERRLPAKPAVPELRKQTSRTIRSMGGPAQPGRLTARPDPDGKPEQLYTLRCPACVAARRPGCGAANCGQIPYMSTGTGQHAQTSVPLDPHQPPAERFRL
jgi:hypothetical protein